MRPCRDSDSPLLSNTLMMTALLEGRKLRKDCAQKDTLLEIKSE